MNKIPKKLVLVLSLCLTALTGCGLVTSAQLPHKDVDTWRTFDPNDYGLQKETDPNGSVTWSWTLDADFDEDYNILPYWKKAGEFVNVPTVKGRINGKTYPVIFDTGCNPLIVLGEDIVLENDLAVFFFKPNDKAFSSALVIAETLKIGSFEVADFPCGLWRYRPSLQLLGLSISSPKWIIFPLSMMSQFRYFQYDNQNKEITFSDTSSFVPKENSQWISFPFRLKGLHLLLDIPIEGIETTWMLDTGAGYEIEMDNALMEEIFKGRPDFEKAWKKTTHLYGPYSDGLQAQKKFRAKNVHFADQVIEHVEIIYTTNLQTEKPYQGVIGFELFKKTILVLDFENHLMWIKKAKGCRFEESE